MTLLPYNNNKSKSSHSNLTQVQIDRHKHNMNTLTRVLVQVIVCLNIITRDCRIQKRFCSFMSNDHCNVRRLSVRRALHLISMVVCKCTLTLLLHKNNQIASKDMLVALMSVIFFCVFQYHYGRVIFVCIF